MKDENSTKENDILEIKEEYKEQDFKQKEILPQKNYTVEHLKGDIKFEETAEFKILQKYKKEEDFEVFLVISII